MGREPIIETFAYKQIVFNGAFPATMKRFEYLWVVRAPVQKPYVQYRILTG